MKTGRKVFTYYVFNLTLIHSHDARLRLTLHV